MMRAVSTITIVAAVVVAAATGAAAQPGKWLWTLDVNPDTSSLVYTGVAGSTEPIIIRGAVFNNDPANALSFDGITLKTDDLFPPNPPLFASLWKVSSAVEMPESFILPGNGKKLGVEIGRFNLANAQPGTYQFRLIGSGSYNNVNADPGDVVSSLITIQVVPEPASAVVLGGGVLSALRVVRRKRVV